MHDLDRTLEEMEGEYEDYDEGFEMEYGDSDEELEYTDEPEAGTPFDEGEEMELASELLEVSDDAELDQFLGKLIKKASRKARKFMKSSTGRAVGKLLKGAAKKALPMVKQALGSYIKGGGMGDYGDLAGMASNLFGMELEGLSPEDQEFEVARKFVRLAGETAVKTAAAPQGAPSKAVARKAFVKAAKRHAPGLLKPGGGSTLTALDTGRTGRWVRRGNRIIVMGV